MSPYVEQVAQALWATAKVWADDPAGGDLSHFMRDKLAPHVDAALMRAYWQGWDDGLAQRREIQPSGAAGRGVLAALGELRAAHTGEPPK